MATPVQLDLRVGIRLEALCAMLADLPAVAEDWPHLTDAERASWSLDWDQTMGALRSVLNPAYRDGTLRGAQRACYEGALTRLREALPSIRQLQLAVPVLDA